MASMTRMSFAEFERLDQGAHDLELLNGELIRVPPPYRQHMEIAERLFELLKAAVERARQNAPERSLGKAHIEMGYLLGGEPPSWLRPDVSLTHPGQGGDRFYVGAPLIAFEIVSDSDTAFHLDEKVSVYLENGCREVWLIYPRKRHAWVHAPNGAVRHEPRRVQSELLPGLDIPLDEIL